MVTDVARLPTGRRVARASIRRVPGIDGVRCLAVIAVMVYHFWDDVLPGGYLGVDVFFVLSGFLITSLLIRENYVKGRVDLKMFWIRRIRRIIPAATLVVFVCTAIAGLIGGDPAVDLKEQFISTLFFVNNWMQIAASHSYFADSGVQLFAHYWSLSVEEQFYLIWPVLFVWFVGMPFFDRRINLIVVLLVMASFTVMVVNFDPTADPTRVYYGTDSHSFGLLTGVLLALVSTSTSGVPDRDSWPPERSIIRHPRLLSIVGMIAVLSILVLMFTMKDTAPVTYRGGLFASSVLTAVLLASVVREVGPVSWLMSLRPLRWIGERSFSLYLWHWPIIVFINELAHQQTAKFPRWLCGVIALALSLVISELSYRFVETPIRRKGYKKVWSEFRLNLPQISVALPSALIVAIFSGMAVVHSPSETQLERDLNEIAQQAKTVSNEGTATLPAPQPQVNMVLPDRETLTGPHPLPLGERITAIGDSVMLASAPALTEAFPGIYIDAEVSRTLNVAPGILNTLLSHEALDAFVVLGFGTNENMSPERIDEVMGILGPNRVAIFVLPFGDRDWIPGSQEQIRLAAERYDNLFIADWCHAAFSNKELVRGDLIHPTPDGASAYTDAVRWALSQWANHRRQPLGECGS